jgi:SAM-dependent methyltransferase
MSDRYSKFDYSRLVNWDERLHREWPFFEAVFADAPSKHLLDLGSGTGEHARFLASKGFDVTGVDSSPNMLEKSRASITPGENVRFLDGDIRDLGSMFDVRFGGALCVGNALPHLSGEDDLQRLKERALPLSFLPDLDNPGATIIFLRPMELLPDGKVIFMPTTLRQRTDSEEPIELVSTRRVEIRGWRRPQIEAAFREAGFSSTEVFGSYARAPFEPAESRDVILVAR